jgi:hypothetical protein
LHKTFEVQETLDYSESRSDAALERITNLFDAMCLRQQCIAGLKTLYIYNCALSIYLEVAPPLLRHRGEDGKEESNYTEAFFSTKTPLLRCVRLCYHEHILQKMISEPQGCMTIIWIRSRHYAWVFMRRIFYDIQA